jgi:hypothetical protein
MTLLEWLDALLDAAGRCDALAVCEHGAELRCEGHAGHVGCHFTTAASNCAIEWD